MDKHVFVVTGAERGERLDLLLARRLTVDQTETARRITSGSVYLDGQRVLQAELRLEAGQKVTCYLARVPRQRPEPTVAHEDRWLAVLDKPSGLLSTPGRRGGEPTVEDFLRERYDARARLLHRLDRGASGLLLVSRSGGKTRKALARQLSSHNLRRLYLALVAGPVDPPRQLLRGAMSVRRGRAQVSQDPRARQAETHLRLLRQGPRTSLVQLRLTTGRTHQIRVHLQQNGSPILGDQSYGGPSAPRLALHAHCLRLRHPATREILEIHSPLPVELRQLL